MLGLIRQPDKMGTARFETMLNSANHDADVVIQCRHCHRKVVWSAITAGQYIGIATRIVRAEARFKCTACRQRGAMLAPTPMRRRWCLAIRETLGNLPQRVNREIGGTHGNTAGRRDA